MNTSSDNTDNERKFEVPTDTSAHQEVAADSASKQITTIDSENPSDVRQREHTNSERWLLGHPLTWNVSLAQRKENVQLSQVSFEELLSILREEGQKRSQKRIRSIAMGAGLFVFSLLMAKFAHNPFFLSHWSPYVVMIIFGWIAVSERQKAAALTIARFDDVRAIGPLTEALGFKDRYIRQIASGALIRLLPRVQASDSVYLGPTQRASLNRALQSKNIDLSLAILKAWEQIGDAEAIPEVAKLAEGRGRNGRIPKVAAAAKECLPFLHQSAARQQVGAQLLRPADGNFTPSVTLLRPTLHHTSNDPAEQLLRPTDAT